ncbi:hypothetical protein CC2G_012639 [Coprinopsis cinerea AmutBmut pab1-1]|nr:hypothetical protein CC2G_012639 [Coprinopsis cinerea AmutBmut pab1-1]
MDSRTTVKGNKTLQPIKNSVPYLRTPPAQSTSSTLPSLARLSQFIPPDSGTSSLCLQQAYYLCLYNQPKEDKDTETPNLDAYHTASHLHPDTRHTVYRPRLP